MEAPHTLRRRWPDTLVFAVIGLPLLAWGIGMLSEGAWYGAIACFFGAASVAVAILGPADGPCPLCGQTLHDFYMLMRGGNHRCAHCKRYFRFEAGKGQELPEDFVSPGPLFPVPIGPGVRFPGLCCVCGATASRVQQVQHRISGPESHASPIVRTLELSLEVPYCERHSGGIQITSENLAPSRPFFAGLANGEQRDTRFVIKVPSYRFYRSSVG